ncbi:MAG: arsenite efflux MFS transporter ArsK [Mesorhizobium sp.]|nr:arsenite efflux MFS transporter ArsK [Mesorhizobium sp.]
MNQPSLSATAIWGLGVTQIIGYGTLYYGFSILAPAMAREFGLAEEWVFAALSVSLVVGAAISPYAGRLADRHGAGRIMTWGSLAAAAALLGCAVAPGRGSFVAALIATELAAAFVLYSTAFVAIVQTGGVRATRSIVHLTLIAGFASTLFWPLTTQLHAHLDWREVYVVFALLNLCVCLPIHAWLTGRSRRKTIETSPLPHEPVALVAPVAPDAAVPLTAGRLIFGLMLVGFAIEGLVLAAILVHMVPLMGALGMGATGLVAATLFGPAQVASRFVNMIFGGRLPQAWLAVIAAGLLPTGLMVLVLTTPRLEGALVFVVLFGLGSGLASIVGGTLPLELFGRAGYGARLGWVTAARQLSAAFAPVGLSALLARVGAPLSLSFLAALAAVALTAFLSIAVLRRARPVTVEAPG